MSKPETTLSLESITKIVLPNPYNFFRTIDDRPISVADLDDDQLQKIGDQMTRNLIEHARAKRRT